MIYVKAETEAILLTENELPINTEVAYTTLNFNISELDIDSILLNSSAIVSVAFAINETDTDAFQGGTWTTLTRFNINESSVGDTFSSNTSVHINADLTAVEIAGYYDETRPWRDNDLWQESSSWGVYYPNEDIATFLINTHVPGTIVSSLYFDITEYNDTFLSAVKTDNVNIFPIPPVFTKTNFVNKVIPVNIITRVITNMEIIT